MNADRRLDQLEPVISELLIKQDRTDKKVDNLTFMVSNITELVITQNDNITFLLKNQLHMSDRIEKIEVRLDRMDARFDLIDARLDRMDARFDRMDARFDEMDGRLDKMDGRFDEMADMQNKILSILLSK